MPAAFSELELARAETLVNSDPRLRLARTRAASGRIAQFLAGAPHLWRRYEQSEGAARAILHAAMDARRCGHGPLLSENFLRVASEGYVDDSTWHSLDEDWFASHLAKLLRPHRQLPGPLMHHRPRPYESPTDSPLYQLADFLHEKSRVTREREHPAPSLWAAAGAHSRTDTDTRELAQAARRLGVVNCEQLYLKAAACGDVTVLRWFTRRLIDLRCFERAEQIIEEAERLARRAYDVSGNRNGHRSLAHHLLALGMRDSAARIYSWAADTGDPVAAVSPPSSRATNSPRSSSSATASAPAARSTCPPTPHSVRHTRPPRPSAPPGPADRRHSHHRPGPQDAAPAECRTRKDR